MNRSSRSALWLMTLTILIDFIGFGLILPFLPFWALHLGANPFQVGLLLTIYALAQFIFTPILGALSDRYGRKPVIVVSLLIEALSLVLTALSSSIVMLLFARFISGLGASNIGSAQAVVADTTPPKERARGMGMIGASIGLGFVIGPALGGVLAPHGETLPFWITAFAALLNMLLVLFFLPETRSLRSVQVEDQRSGGAIWLIGWRHVRHYPVLLTIVTVNFLFTVAFTSMETVLPLFTQHFFKWSAEQNGYLFTYVGVIMVVMQGGLVRRLVKIWNEQTIMLAGLVLLGIGLVMIAFSSQVALLFAGLGILSVGEGAVTPTISTLLSFASPAGSQGEILGLSQGLGGLGRIVGPVLASSLYARFSPGTPLVSGGILVVMVAVGAFFPLRSIARPESTVEISVSDAVDAKKHEMSSSADY